MTWVLSLATWLQRLRSVPSEKVAWVPRICCLPIVVWLSIATPSKGWLTNSWGLKWVLEMWLSICQNRSEVKLCVWHVLHVHISEQFWQMLQIWCIIFRNLFKVIEYQSVTSSNFHFCITALSWPYFSRTWWKPSHTKFDMNWFTMSWDMAAWICN